jgi:tRNA 2-(methylsulfanyl)-N6-isopentenyladenosine37 hydroxylase
MSRLLCSTDPLWAQTALADFNTFLQDHANCERKALAMAMSFISRYPDRAELIEAMIGLAREELDHFAQVYALMAARGVTLANDEKDPYVGSLLVHARNGRDQLLLDRLLISGVIEARGCERFQLVAEALQEKDLKQFYLDLARSEARHAGLFVRVARHYFSESTIDARLEELYQIEAEIIKQMPARAALH